MLRASKRDHELLESAVRRLHEAGHKVTNARRTILAVVCESRKHLSSSDILTEVETRDPEIGRASVFRNLELLTRLSIIRPTCLEARTPVYVVMPENGHHAHIVCPRCSKVTDIEECEVEELIERVANEHNVLMAGHLLELYGVCTECLVPDSDGEPRR
jgi:Fur family ferric uptake transcriptional regulator